MKRSEVLAWLKSHGGQADYQVEFIEQTNPNKKLSSDPDKISVKKVTWTAKDGQKLSVLDRGETQHITPAGSTGPDANPQGGDPGYNEPVYEMVGSDTTPGRDQDIRTPEAKANDEKLDAQRRKNEQQTGNWETDTERRNRENQENDRRRQTDADERRNQIEQDRLDLEREREARANRGEGRADAAERRAEANAEREAELGNRRITLEEDRYNFEREKANRPQVISTPKDDDKSIAIFNPATGAVEAQDNPLYDEAKTRAKQKQDELALAIQQNKIDADTAAQEYTQWFQRNVQVPFMQAAERRAQATEKRQTLEAEERRRQFKATYEQKRQEIGINAGEKAADQEIAMMPYRVGPAYGEQMSSAINSLAAGGSMNTNAAAGIHFTKDAFEYKRPDLAKISKKATAAALKHLTSYQPSDDEYEAPDYSGIMMPNAETMTGAPAMRTPIDTRSMFEDWKNTRYGAPTQ